MTDTANAPEQGNMPDTIMAWPDFDGCVTGSWSANQYSDERARKYVLATLDGGQIEEPTEPGSFVGDIWFGDQIKRTRGTHRWDGAAWQSLPTETEVLIELLAKERAKIARLTEALKGAVEIVHKSYVLATMEAVNAGPASPIAASHDAWRAKCVRVEESARAALQENANG